MLYEVITALTPRDQWIGWSANERLRNLGFVVNNGRFLIFPWVKVRYLASHVLGKIVKGLVKDWEQRWEYQPALLETFVDPQYFNGTCYQAANFKYLGMTTGVRITSYNVCYTKLLRADKRRFFWGWSCSVFPAGQAPFRWSCQDI